MPIRPERPSLPARELAAWRELIRERCGIEFGDSRVEYLGRRLCQRMRARGLASYEEYRRYVEISRNGHGEWSRLLELLVVRESGFFRHPPSFEALSRHVLPRLLDESSAGGGQTLFLWSAGCATGEEAYSLAAVAIQATFSHPATVRVYGSDVSRTGLAKARRGLYRPQDVSAVPEPYRRKYFSRVQRESGDLRQPVAQVREVVRFGSFNLMEPPSYGVEAQDVIFCQNVLVYMREELRAEMVRRLCDRLRPGGCLFLAPGEVVGLKLPGVESDHFDQCLVYRRAG